MAAVEIDNLTRAFRGARGEPVRAVEDLTLAVADRELLVVVGPSGCGKTTLLRLLAGLEVPDRGTIRLGGEPLDGLVARDRDVAMVFQNQALYPHMTASENLEFGMRLRRVPRAEINRRVGETAAWLGITDCLGRLPAELSGGQRQRVALGRATIRRPKLLLLDEPLSNLDEPLRVQMRRELLRLHAQLGITVILVTHDQAEAMALGQRVAVMSAGALLQVDPPGRLYQRPANLFVAGFLGSPPMNLVEGEVVSDSGQLVFQATSRAAETRVKPLRLQFSAEWTPRLAPRANQQVVLGLRPEGITLNSAGSDARAPWKVEVVVEAVELAGHEAHVRLSAGGATLVARVHAAAPPRAGEGTVAILDPRAALFFDAASGQAIG